MAYDYASGAGSSEIDEPSAQGSTLVPQSITALSLTRIMRNFFCYRFAECKLGRGQRQPDGNHRTDYEQRRRQPESQRVHRQ